MSHEDIETGARSVVASFKPEASVVQVLSEDGYFVRGEMGNRIKEPLKLFSENRGCNDAKNCYHLEHICHHERRSLLLVWLLTLPGSHHRTALPHSLAPPWWPRLGSTAGPDVAAWRPLPAKIPNLLLSGWFHILSKRLDI